MEVRSAEQWYGGGGVSVEVRLANYKAGRTAVMGEGECRGKAGKL